MPTENRSSNTDPRDLFIRDNPLGLGEKELAKDRTGFADQRTHSDYLTFLAGYEAAQPAEQPQGEPIMLTAAAKLVDDGDGGLEASWLLEGGTSELFEGMLLLVAHNAPELCEEDGSAEVYANADAGELELARKMLRSVQRREKKWALLCGGRNNQIAELRAQLAEAQEVLRDCIEVGELDAETKWKALRVSKGRRLYVDDGALSTLEVQP